MISISISIDFFLQNHPRYYCSQYLLLTIYVEEKVELCVHMSYRNSYAIKMTGTLERK